MTWTEDRYSEYINSTYDSYVELTWASIGEFWSVFDMEWLELTPDITPIVGNWNSDFNTNTGGILIKELGQFTPLPVEEETLGDSSGGEGDFTAE